MTLPQQQQFNPTPPENPNWRWLKRSAELAAIAAVVLFVCYQQGWI